MIRAKDYFDPQIYERMAQIRANAALQKGNIGANQAQQNAQIFSTLIQQLAQLGTKAYQTGQANDYFAPKDYTVGDQRPIGGEQVVRTDLVRKPITPTLIPQYQEQGTFNPMIDPQSLMAGQMNPNEEIARRSQIGIQNLLMQQPKYAEGSPGAFMKQTNPFSTAPDFQVPNRPLAQKPQISLLGTRQEERNGRMKTVNEYGYINGDGDKVITKVDYEDFTKPRPINPFQGDKRLIKSYQDSFNADPSIKAFKEQGLSLGAVNGLIDQANSGNQVSAAALGVKMAKVMGEVGMLSENDVTRYVQAKSLSRGSADILKKWGQGVPTTATLSEIREIANVMRTQFTEKLQPVIDLHANQMAEGLGISVEDAYKYLSSEQLTNPPSQTNTQQTQKRVVKKQYSPSANKTKLIYSDGTQEILDGKK